MELGYFSRSTNRPHLSVGASQGNRSLLIAGVVGVAAYFFYKYILYHYYLGDPFHYQRYYDAVAGRDVISAWFLQSDYLGSSELIYPAIAWLSSNAGIERNTAMAVFDGIMYATLFAALRIYRCSPVFIALSLTNFYLVVLATSAERLKFSYICLFVALMVVGRARFIWLALAPLAHFQSLIAQSSIFIWHLFSSVPFRVKVALIALAAIVGGVVLYFFSSMILGKFTSYEGRGGLVDLFSGLALVCVALAIYKNKFQVFISMMPLIILTFILGSERMNMVTFTAFIYMAIKEGRTANPIVLILMMYFSGKSFEFIRNIFLYGNGFV